MRIVLLLLVLFAASFAYLWQAANDGTPVKWPDFSIPPHYQMNQNGTPDCQFEELALVYSHNAWNMVSGAGFDWVYDGKTSRGPCTPWFPVSDGYNICGWLNPWLESPSAIAINITWYDENNGDISECDQTFNDMYFHWSDSGNPDEMDIQNIDTHETGHTLLLLDLYDSPSAEFTMYGYASEGETKKRTLEDDDENGIRFLYPGGPITGVELTDFTATRTARGNLVHWEAVENTLHAGYNLYRRDWFGSTSQEKINRQGYVRVNPSLITGKNSYDYRDQSSNERKVQYILADVDVAGHETFHGPIVCLGKSRGAALSLRCYPNPTRDAVTLAYTLPADLAYKTAPSLHIYDLSGRTIVDFNLTQNAGENKFNWDTNTVPSGVYIASLEAAGHKAVARIVVAR